MFPSPWGDAKQNESEGNWERKKEEVSTERTHEPRRCVPRGRSRTSLAPQARWESAVAPGRSVARSPRSRKHGDVSRWPRERTRHRRRNVDGGESQRWWRDRYRSTCSRERSRGWTCAVAPRSSVEVASGTTPRRPDNNGGVLSSVRAPCSRGSRPEGTCERANEQSRRQETNGVTWRARRRYSSCVTHLMQPTNQALSRAAQTHSVSFSLAPTRRGRRRLLLMLLFVAHVQPTTGWYRGRKWLARERRDTEPHSREINL